VFTDVTRLWGVREKNHTRDWLTLLSCSIHCTTTTRVRLFGSISNSIVGDREMNETGFQSLREVQKNSTSPITVTTAGLMYYIPMRVHPQNLSYDFDERPMELIALSTNVKRVVHTSSLFIFFLSLPLYCRTIATIITIVADFSDLLLLNSMVSACHYHRHYHNWIHKLVYPYHMHLPIYVLWQP